MITGATGFAGSFLVEHYAGRGWKVVGTRRDDDDLSWVPDDVTIRRIDLSEWAPTAELVASCKPELVFHLAAQSSVALSWDDPMGTLEGNASAQYNILEAVRVSGHDSRVLVVGSCDEYGNVGQDDNPIGEGHPLRPANPYALSKVAQDLMGYQYFEAFGMQVVRARPFLQIGPRRSSRFVAGSFAKQVAEIALGLRDPIIRVGNIDLHRDFLDVRDVVRAYALLAQSGRPGDVYNIASGTAHSLRDMLQAMMHAARIHAEVREDPLLRREGETPLLVGDAGKLRAVTGWSPSLTFEQSASDTVDYWRSRLGHALVTGGNQD